MKFFSGKRKNVKLSLLQYSKFLKFTLSYKVIKTLPSLLDYPFTTKKFTMIFTKI